MNYVGFKTDVLARMAVIEKAIVMLGDGMNDVRDKVDNLRDNHLHEVNDKLDMLTIKVNSNPTWLITMIITMLSSILTGVAIKLLTKG